MLLAFIGTAGWIPAILGLGRLVPLETDDDVRIAVLVAGALSIAAGDVTRIFTSGRARKPVLSWPEFPAVAFERRTTNSGLVVNVPTSGDQCWATPLPCTPYFRPELSFFEGRFTMDRSVASRTAW